MYYFLSSVFISFYGYSSENFIDPTTLSRHMTESRFLVTTLEFEISFLQGSFTVLVKLSFWWTVPPLLRFDVCLTSFFVSFLYVTTKHYCNAIFCEKKQRLHRCSPCFLLFFSYSKNKLEFFKIVLASPVKDGKIHFFKMIIICIKAFFKILCNS